MLSDSLGKKHKLKWTSQGSLSLHIYEAFIEYISNQKQQPKYIIIPINLRSFTPSWDWRPEYQFNPEKIYLKDNFFSILYRPLSVFKFNYDTITYQKFYEQPIKLGNKIIGYNKDTLIAKTQKDRFIYYYMADIEASNRNTIALQSILSNKNLKSKLILYFNAIDVYEGERYLPNQFTKEIQKNKLFLASIISKYPDRASYIDFIDSIPHKYFDYQDEPNEHLNQTGKMYVAQKLKQEILRLENN
jgi:hypothetical protein